MLEGAMVGLGIAVAAVAAFIISSVYYTVVTPLERRAVGAAALDRGRPRPWKVLTELLRTAIVASAFAWIAHRGGDLDIRHGLVLALIMWAGFPLVLLTGSVIWERVHPATAAIHTGDWLVKLLLIAVILGLIH
jgi:hypothetical protein